MGSRKVVEVGCAIIFPGRHFAGERGKLLIAQRKPGDSLGGYWEFPGGRWEKGESLEQCLEREVREELGICIAPRRYLGHSEHVTPGKKVRLHFYICEWIAGRPARHDCRDFRWVGPSEMRAYRFPPGDDGLLYELIRRHAFYFPK